MYSFLIVEYTIFNLRMNTLQRCKIRRLNRQHTILNSMNLFIQYRILEKNFNFFKYLTCSVNIFWKTSRHSFQSSGTVMGSARKRAGRPGFFRPGEKFKFEPETRPGFEMQRVNVIRNSETRDGSTRPFAEPWLWVNCFG